MTVKTLPRSNQSLGVPWGSVGFRGFRGSSLLPSCVVREALRKSYGGLRGSMKVCGPRSLTEVLRRSRRSAESRGFCGSSPLPRYVVREASRKSYGGREVSGVAWVPWKLRLCLEADPRGLTQVLRKSIHFAPSKST
jgi:hypothetical protein